MTLSTNGCSGRHTSTTLERKVEERTRQLELANLGKSRFLAAASHDLRQPLHALGLFVAQLHGRMRADERRRIVSRIDAALSAMNELFNALLDMSKLDAGVLSPNIAEFPVARLLKRVETTFAGPAREKGLSLRVVPSTAWVRSDFILLERIVFNLVSNAVRYTSSGGLLIGCRERHVLNALVDAPWVRTDDLESDDDDRFFAALQELVAYAFEESVRIKKKGRLFPGWHEIPVRSSHGILQEVQSLLQKYRSEVVRQSRLLDQGGRA
jgi:hypothetical protein